MKLSELSLNDLATVVKVIGQDAIARRLVDMGVVPNQQVRIVRVAPLGDPIQIKIMNYNLAIRKSEANRIIVNYLDQ